MMKRAKLSRLVSTGDDVPRPSGYRSDREAMKY
jgi:hypothetical protein